MRVEIKHILYATGLSDFSNHTVAFGVALAHIFDARLHICHVIDPAAGLSGKAYRGQIDQHQEAMEIAGSEVKRLVINGTLD